MNRTHSILLSAIALSFLIASPTQTVAQTAAPPDATRDVFAAAPAQSNEQREFRFAATTKVSTMEKELNELAAQGFRLEHLSKSSLGDDVAALLVRDPAAAKGVRYEYKILSTQRAGTLGKEIIEAAGQGYELSGLTSMLRPGIAMFFGDETAAVMERRSGEGARRFEYKLLSTRREKTMQKELDAAVSEGYVPVEMILGQDNNAASFLIGPQFVDIIILVRQPGGAGAAAAPREFKFLTTNRVGTMEREMTRATKEGYRFYMSAPGLRVLMYRERGANAALPYQYKLLATRKTGTMQKELLEYGAQGYKYLATSNGMGGLTTVLERDTTADPKESRREYKLLATTREKTTRKEIADTLAAGYRILDLTTIGEFILVLDRRAENAPASEN